MVRKRWDQRKRSRAGNTLEPQPRSSSSQRKWKQQNWKGKFNLAFFNRKFGGYFSSNCLTQHWLKQFHGKTELEMSSAKVVLLFEFLGWEISNWFWFFFSRDNFCSYVVIIWGAHSKGIHIMCIENGNNKIGKVISIWLFFQQNLAIFSSDWMETL